VVIRLEDGDADFLLADVEKRFHFAPIQQRSARLTQKTSSNIECSQRSVLADGFRIIANSTPASPHQFLNRAIPSQAPWQ
jgi:hypothetical protein